MGPEATDEELVRLSAAGDRRAFEALLARHELALFRYATRSCGSAGDAEDALQDGLLAAWRGAATFRGEATARTWLFQVVIHACRRRQRRRSGEPAQLDGLEAADSVPSGERGPEVRVADAQLGLALEQALGELPDEAREVLLLRDVEGLPGDEAAAALGVGLAAMKSRLHRARLELKARVEARLRPRREVRP